MCGDIITCQCKGTVHRLPYICIYQRVIVIILYVRMVHSEEEESVFGYIVLQYIVEGNLISAGIICLFIKEKETTTTIISTTVRSQPH